MFSVGFNLVLWNFHINHSCPSLSLFRREARHVFFTLFQNITKPSSPHCTMTVVFLLFLLVSMLLEGSSGLRIISQVSSVSNVFSKMSSIFQLLKILIPRFLKTRPRVPKIVSGPLSLEDTVGTACLYPTVLLRIWRVTPKSGSWLSLLVCLLTSWLLLPAAFSVDSTTNAAEDVHYRLECSWDNIKLDKS